MRVYTDLVCKYEAVFCKPLTDIMHMFSSAKGEVRIGTGGGVGGCRCLNVLNNAEIAHYYVYARGIIHFLLHRTLVSPLAALRDR